MQLLGAGRSPGRALIADDLLALQTAMGYTQQEATQQLGISWATYKRHLVGIPANGFGLRRAGDRVVAMVPPTAPTMQERQGSYGLA